jgi:hypothetical protein
MPITQIDWALLACPLDESFHEFLTPHLLQGIERRRRWPYSDLEFYVSTGSLPLHVDDLGPENGLIIGMILECADDFELTTGRSRAAAKAGDVYLLEPGRRHGALTEGFYAFAALDVPVGGDVCPERFRKRVVDELRTMLTGTHNASC